MADGLEPLVPLPPGFNAGLFVRPDTTINYGSAPPPPVYRALAGAILRNAPFNCRPIDVAYYFSNLRERRPTPALLAEAAAVAMQAGQPEFANPAFLSFFAYDWERNRFYNPVVIGLFNGVHLTATAGDQTPWCAVFANWCIARSRATTGGEVVFSPQRRAFGSGSASSGSFRCWGRDAGSDPREGDVIVWARDGTVSSRCPSFGQGHIAFLRGVELGPDGKPRYLVVGGNQGWAGSGPVPAPGTPVRRQDIAQAVSSRKIGARFGDRALHSIRTENYLR